MDRAAAMALLQARHDHDYDLAVCDRVLDLAVIRAPSPQPIGGSHVTWSRAAGFEVTIPEAAPPAPATASQPGPAWPAATTAQSRAIRAATAIAEGHLRASRASRIPSLYAGLMTGSLSLDGVQGQVRRLYAAIVAADLRPIPFAAPLVQRLEQGTAEPWQVTENLCLEQGALYARLLTRLQTLTGDAALSRALALLVRPGLEQPAWDWLTGAAPSQLLAEQGIPGHLRDPPRALTALTAIARLYGQPGPRHPPPHAEPGIEP